MYVRLRYLSVPPEVAKQMPEEMQRLIGYTLYSDALGYYGNFQHPRESFSTPAASGGGSDPVQALSPDDRAMLQSRTTTSNNSNRPKL